jgi:hypothetical protein
MIGYRHERPRREVVANPTRSIGEDHDPCAERDHRSDTENHPLHAMSFIQVQPALHRDHR